ncbi:MULTISPECIES: hypothetical protein [unclassified Acinetobacter]|uniref:hypothetical protein n=1 Tax=unclassified Acinetobacter TaxID=196816 RepID=UPI0035BB4707
MTEQQEDILTINQIQLLLSEKRTALSIMRTGIAIFAIPLSIFSILIATSKQYDLKQVWQLFTLVSILNILLIMLSCYLVVSSLQHLKHYESKIKQLKSGHPSLKHLL